jgi:hypothetical protein
MGLTDRDLLVATQIAYYDFDYNLLMANGFAEPLKELLTQDTLVITKLRMRYERVEKRGSELEKSRIASALKLYEEITSDTSPYGNWIIRNIKDDNEYSGFYACLIEVSEKECIIAFRGSESTDASQVQKDWINSDFGLLNSTLTEQQAVASVYMYDLFSYYEYEKYSVTGHSLGGNLASHGAVTAPMKMKERLSRCISFDGPGFSKNYTEEYAGLIGRIGGKITHFQWSLVGTLLYHLEDSFYESIETSEKVYGKYDIPSLLQKHDTSFVVFNEEGYVLEGKMDRFAKYIGELSRSLDSVPQFIGDKLVWGIGKIMMLKEKERKIIGGAFILGLGLLALEYPIQILVTILIAAGAIFLALIDFNFYGSVLLPVLTGSLAVMIHIINVIMRYVLKILRVILKGRRESQGDISKEVAEAVQKFIPMEKEVILDTYHILDYIEQIDYVEYKIVRLTNYVKHLKFHDGDFGCQSRVGCQRIIESLACIEKKGTLAECKSQLLKLIE